MFHCTIFLRCPLLFAGVCLLWLSGVNTARANSLVYLGFEETATFPANPAIFSLNATSFDVPAGAVLRVHLLRGDQLVSTSTLTFQSAYQAGIGIGLPPQVAAFYPTGTPNTDGVPIENTLLQAGTADLNAIAVAPEQYRFLWDLSSGLIGRANRVQIFNQFVGLTVLGFGGGASLNDQKPGSVLFFHRYSSNASNALREDTQITLTNTNPSAIAFLRLFLVAGSTCQVNELQLCLAAQQTTSFRMSDLDPGMRGYLIAVATDATGKPVQFNWLTGSATLKNGLLTTVLNAYAVSKREGSVIAAGNDNLAELVFNDEMYDHLPAQLAYEGVGSQVHAENTTTLSVYRPLANLVNGSISATVQITGRSAAIAGAQTTGSVALACYSDVQVSNLRLSPTTAANLLPQGTTGWFSLATADLKPLFGSQLNVGVFSGGASPRAQAFATEYRIKLPVVAVNCSQ